LELFWFLTANFVIIYGLGVPFIPGDALKLIVAASFVKILKG